MIDFYDTINAHIAWKKRLLDYISGDGEPLDSDEVCRDDCCSLGQWIHAQNSTYQTIPEFQQMRSVHAEFHRCAGTVVRLVDADQRDEATELLQGEYASTSHQVKKSIISFSKLLNYP